MAQPVPWYYRLYWKIEGWLQSKTIKSLNADRSLFYKKHSEASSREAPKIKPVEASASLHLRHKPMHETIRQGYF